MTSSTLALHRYPVLYIFPQAVLVVGLLSSQLTWLEFLLTVLCFHCIPHATLVTLVTEQVASTRFRSYFSFLFFLFFLALAIQLYGLCQSGGKAGHRYSALFKNIRTSPFSIEALVAHT